MPINDSNTPQIYSINLPNWFNDFLNTWGGIQPQAIAHHELLNLCEHGSVPWMIVEETYLKDHFQTLSKLLQQNKIDCLIIYIHHPFFFDTGILNQLDVLAQQSNIHMMVNGYYSQEYQHLPVYNIDTWEHSISHYFNLLLSNTLQKHRNPSHLFLMQTVFKDTFRNTVGDFLKNSSIYSEFLPFTQANSVDLYRTVENFMSQLKQTHGQGPHIDALGSYGNGLPNFKMYEKAFCELVLETRNSGAWHFTEKTFRPIALGIPIIHLGNQTIHNRLLQYGYQLYDHQFYSVWHSDVDQSQKLQCLLQFLQHINNNSTAQEQMIQTAQHNHHHFYNQRKNNYYKTIQHMFETVFGQENLTYKIYKQLDF